MRSLRSKNFFTVQCLPGSPLPNRYQYSRCPCGLQEQIVKNAIWRRIFSFSKEKTEKLTKSIRQIAYRSAIALSWGIDRVCIAPETKKVLAADVFCGKDLRLVYMADRIQYVGKPCQLSGIVRGFFCGSQRYSPVRNLALPSGRRTFSRTAQSDADWSPPAPE